MWNQVQQALDNSMTRVMTGIADLLPGILALVVAVAISGLIAWVASWALQVFLRRIDFDARLERTWGGSVAELSRTGSPTVVLARTVAAIIVLFGLTIGIAAIDSSLTSRLFAQFFTYIPNLVVAMLLLVIGRIVANYFARSVLIGAVNMNIQYPRLLSTGVKWLILVFAITMALNHMGIGGQIVGVAFAILFGGITLTLSLAIGLGARNFVSRTLEERREREEQPEEQTFHHS